MALFLLLVHSAVLVAHQGDHARRRENGAGHVACRHNRIQGRLRHLGPQSPVVSRLVRHDLHQHVLQSPVEDLGNIDVLRSPPGGGRLQIIRGIPPIGLRKRQQTRNPNLGTSRRDTIPSRTRRPRCSPTPSWGSCGCRSACIDTCRNRRCRSFCLWDLLYNFSRQWTNRVLTRGACQNSP
jgi:hypothetical protein